MNKISSISAVLLLLLTSACRSGAIANAPASPAPSAEQQIYASLMTAQTAIEGVRAQPDLIAPIKTQLNQAIASYNTAEKAFVDYEASKTADLTNSTDIIKLQQMVLDLQTQITVLGQAFKPSTPTPPAPAPAK